MTLAYRMSNVGFELGDTKIIQNVSLSVDSGERVAILGASGAGKTTLLRLLAAQIKPSAGDVFLHNENTRNLNSGAELSEYVGVINQQYDLIQELSVRNNVLAGNLGRWNIWRSILTLLSSIDSDISASALERVGLSDKTHQRLSRLSGGEQQRVAVARLIVQDPLIIIADEPVASLDPTRAFEIMSLLENITSPSNKTLIAALHSYDLTTQFFERVIGLKNGKVSFDMRVDHLTKVDLEKLYSVRPTD